MQHTRSKISKSHKPKKAGLHRGLILLSSNRPGQVIHTETQGTYEISFLRKTKGDDKQTSFCAEREVMSRGLEAFRKGFMGEEDYLRADRFGLHPDVFFLLAYEGRDTFPRGVSLIPAQPGLPGAMLASPFTEPKLSQPAAFFNIM